MATISEVAQKVGVTPNALRYYEEVGALPQIARDENGFRHYYPHDIERAEMVHVLRKMNMPIRTIVATLEKITATPTVADLQQFIGQLDTLLGQLDAQIATIEQEKALVAHKRQVVTDEIQTQLDQR
ncbi:MAG: MerR family transcriptional regulator [Lactobacillus sp.]|jgi:DNA-binding transcriptional MerR regulator|nr:MerR family transcriptional regulator [Lactobacillus sp.]MCI2032752.1 MerR family transcriptional regulator [Lactobacillus sp.]